eukprot:Hpha_TRINITY_DN10700_c0_g1::TRINITY_DN10700_c0_g1_i1::g.43740::m.43740
MSVRWLSVRAQDAGDPAHTDTPGGKRARGAAPVSCEPCLKRPRAPSPRHSDGCSIVPPAGKSPERGDLPLHLVCSLRRVLSVLGGLDELEEGGTMEMILDEADLVY